MKVLKLLAFIILSIHASAQVPPGYYDNANGLTAAPLKQALHDIITGHNILQYNQLWTVFKSTDARIDTTEVWDIYSDVPGGTPPYIYEFASDQCGQYNSEGDCFNREHSLPKSWYNDAFPMFSDLHALYPVDGFVNGQRSNLPYGEVGAADWTSDNGSKRGASNVQGFTGTVFEPIDAYKGDLARTYFYMLTRYKDEAPNWIFEPEALDFLQNGNFTQWAEYMLIQWHINDPVSTKELDRNNAVYIAQGNRNPYIDNPQWVQAIWGPTASIEEHRRNIGFSIHAAEVVIDDAALLGEAFEVRDVCGRLLRHGTVSANRFPLPTLQKGLHLLSIKQRSVRFCN